MWSPGWICMTPSSPEPVSLVLLPDPLTVSVLAYVEFKNVYCQIERT